jgi:pyrimidine-nucleoside phosphorylase
LAVGNALEIREAVATLSGEGPDDFTELVLTSSARLLALSDLGVDVEEGRRRAESAVEDGSALERYDRWIRAQGGDPSLDVLPAATVVRPVPAPATGTVTEIGAIRVGVAALELGAGRRTKEDAIDHSVGVVCLVKRGQAVEAGAPLAEIHAGDDASAERAAAAVLEAYAIGGEPPREHPIVLDVIA